MSTEAWERAVEAGATVLTTYQDPMEALDMHGIREKADHILRAAFPILAEEFMAALNEDFDPEYPEYSKRLIRARIEQMKEITE
ncbi:MAG: hypothetical protein P0Y66_22445 [Candidatus Kaistia colombiensis]|nr:MAG: hypothetical protein P0Y66_22445 [Kaistia sp.]